MSRAVGPRHERTLDFVVVGAQKSGTTALYEYLRGHPAIALPAGKEAPFFNLDAYYARGLGTFIDDHFPGVAPERIRGVISPQYMTSDRITDRVALALPGARIAAVLRDPVERAVSHYKMALRRRQESRSIDDALRAMLEPGQIRRARELPAAPESESRCYVAWGEYGRILSRYAERYPREQIKVMFFEELIADPEATLDGFLDFVGVAPGYRPDNLGERVFEGGTESRFADLRKIAKRLLPSALWDAVPRSTRASLGYAFERLNTKPPREGARPVTPSPDVEEALTEFFRADVQALEQTFGVRAPWPRFAARASSRDGGAKEASRAAAL